MNCVILKSTSEKMMNQESMWRSSGRFIGRLIVAVSLIITMTVSLMPRARAQADDAEKILKAMSEYVASQKTISLKFDSDI
jgi:hypothetical protein